MYFCSVNDHMGEMISHQNTLHEADMTEDVLEHSLVSMFIT